MFQKLSEEEFERHIMMNDIVIPTEQLQYGAIPFFGAVGEAIADHYMITEEYLYWEQTVIASSKTWPFMHLLNRIVQMQAESGIGKYWEYRATINTIDMRIQRKLKQNGKLRSRNIPSRLEISFCFRRVR